MEPLTINIRILRAWAMWPEENSSKFLFYIKHYFVILTFMPSGTSSLLGTLKQFQHLEDITILIDLLIGFCALSAGIYMCECLVQSVQKIRELSKEITNFGPEFGAQEVIAETENNIQLYTKVIILYGLIGNLCYSLFPVVLVHKCERERHLPPEFDIHDPCGLVIRSWYPYDISGFPMFYVTIFIQIYTCSSISVLVLTITMTLVGLLMYAVALLKHCGEYVRNCCEATTQEEMERNVYFCIKYHTAIILYSANITDAFSIMMLCHITLTSFEISVLGFQIIMVDDFTDSIRFAMHLAGWLVLLFLVCFYGQNLIDESFRIGVHAYESSWYNAPVKVQKDIQMIILRSQKPLTLSAASLGIMSLETFLGIISTAYSYFTLLVNMKEDKK